MDKNTGATCGRCSWRDGFSGACCYGGSLLCGDFTDEDTPACWAFREEGKK